MIDFQKTRYCPSSEMLAAFAEDGNEVKDDAFVRRHLEICEFWRAEGGFYVLFPPPADEPATDPGPVPPPLYELAEALLDRSSNLRAFYRLVGG